MPRYSGIWTLSQVNQAIKNLDWEGVPPTGVEYLVVAGGGGGGNGRGGGGGAGGLLQGYAAITPNTSYTVTVGTGGAGSTSGSVAGSSGVNSVFGAITATGGGGGGSASASRVGSAGGSGGGGGDDSSGPWPGGAGISSQGNPGGASNNAAAKEAGGGGGGAGTVGFAALTSAGGSGGNGGAGIASDITGTRLTYAGGGGGGSGYSTGATAGVGGPGGGGTGALYTSSTPPTTGTPNTGGGGGGGAYNIGTIVNGAAGGSGIVVIRYPGNIQYFTGGTLNYSNGYIVHTFYSSGVLAPTAPRLFASPDYQISRSLRFNATNTYLSRTYSSASTDLKRQTFSVWVKRGNLGTATYFMSGYNGTAGAATYIGFNASNQMQFVFDGATAQNLITTQLFRDSSAWYHIVAVADTTQTTASDRLKLYVNGTQITSFATATYPAINTTSQFALANAANAIGSLYSGNSPFFDGYLTEFNFIDGQALTPASFGYVEPSTGAWTPLQYVGSYGTNGFYLNFADNSGITATTLGKDLSGNANNWTPNNFSVTAGSGNSSLVDTPTNYGVDTGVGGEVRGNYCTLNPLSQIGGSTVLNGNLDGAVASNDTSCLLGTFAVSSGKWYWEWTPTTNLIYNMAGITSPYASSKSWQASSTFAYWYTGSKYNNNISASYGATYALNDIIGVALDMDAGTVTFYKNGISQGVAYTGLTGIYTPYFGNAGSGTIAYFTANFGQRPFAYTAPSGFKALCTQNLPESAVGKLSSKYFNTVLWTGSGSVPRSVGGVGFQPDLSWLVRRDVGYGNWLYDSVRGATKALSANSTAVEQTYGQVGSFDADGFTQTIAVDQGNNINGGLYVAWNWKAGGTAVTNTAGATTSQVSANTQAGFSVVTYTGNGANTTIGHGLGTVPSMIIQKYRNSVTDWFVYHVSLGTNKYLVLDTTASTVTDAAIWQNTAPTSSIFYVGSGINGSTSNMVAYCWAEVAGFSKFGSYLGTANADGAFVYCGFRPRWIMFKDSTNGSWPWVIVDTARNTYNVMNAYLTANSTNLEATNFTGNAIVDSVSNGFKVRTTDAYTNTSGSTIIFAAFAESPFKYARAR